MSLRFRHSVRLFPGVRLNFSGSGISTTIGVRGASMTLGRHGTHLNVGLPGTGLSYRTRISPGSSGPGKPRQFAPSSFDEAPDVGAPPTGNQISSADVNSLTSLGLGELKGLVNEAAAKRVELTDAVVSTKRKIERARKRLRFAETFVFRIFMTASAIRLRNETSEAVTQLEAHQDELEGCYIEIDFAFDDAALNSYAALVRSFEALSTSQAIWDITATSDTNRVVERTIAVQSIARTNVSFEFIEPPIIKSKYRCMKMGDASGRDLCLFPGFILMRDTSNDFALIEYPELDVAFRPSKFIEEEQLPSDSQVVGQTWKKANKDGSPDRRFNGNYAIPIAQYGEILFRSPTGLLEAYMFSHCDKASAFAQALAGHRRALIASGKAGRTLAADPLPTAGENTEVPLEESELFPSQQASHKRPSFVPDWIALSAAIVALAGGVGWGTQHGWKLGGELPASPPVAPVISVGLPTPAPLPAPKVQRRRKAVVRVQPVAPVPPVEGEPVSEPAALEEVTVIRTPTPSVQQ